MRNYSPLTLVQEVSDKGRAVFADCTTRVYPHYLFKETPIWGTVSLEWRLALSGQVTDMLLDPGLQPERPIFLLGRADLQSVLSVPTLCKLVSTFIHEALPSANPVTIIRYYPFLNIPYALSHYYLTIHYYPNYLIYSFWTIIRYYTL